MSSIRRPNCLFSPRFIRSALQDQSSNLNRTSNVNFSTLGKFNAAHSPKQLKAAKEEYLAVVKLLNRSSINSIPNKFISRNLNTSVKFAEILTEKGIESDRNINTCHAYGKRKTWHLIGTVLSMFTFPFIFQPCYGGEHATKGAIIFYSMLIIVFQFAWTSIQINHMSIATDLSPYSCERVKLTARRSSFTVISNILVYLFFWFVLHISKKQSINENDKFSPDDAGHFRLIVITLVCVGLAFSAFFHIFVREKAHNIQIKRDNDANSVDYSNRLNHLQWKHWFKFKVFHQVASLYMASRLIVNLTQVFVPLYLHHTLDLNKESIAYIPLVIYCSGFVGSVLVETANQRFTNLQIFLVGSIVSLIAFIWIYLGTSETYIKFYIYFVSVLIGLSGQTININSKSVLNDMIGQNTASSAFVFGAMSFLDKFSNGSAVMIIQIMREAETFKTMKPFLRYVLSYVCGGASIAAIIIIISLASHNFDNDLSRSRLIDLNIQDALDQEV